MTSMRTVSLLAATVTMGLSAGVFDLYAHTILPGLKTTDDRTFVGAFQAIDRAIINPWFIGATFFGALVATTLATITHRHQPSGNPIAFALAAYLVVVIITLAVNVPLNNAIKAAGDPDTINATAIRGQFNEARWAAWNLVRMVTSTGGFIGLAWALVLHGRATA